MSLPSAVIDALIASGCTAEQLGAAMKAANAEADARRESKRANNAERQRRFRERHKGDDNADNALRGVTECDGVTQPPLSRPPNENNSNPPTHTPPDNISTRARADDFPCPEGVDPTDWAGLKANRKAKRAALTTGAHRQIVRKLEGWARDGWPPGPIVATAVERGWTTVFETDEMKAPRNERSQQVPRKDHRNGIALALDRRLGLGDPAREAGRYPTGGGEADCGRALALAPPGR